MIEINKINNFEEPYIILKKKYQDALNKNQKNIEAISISSYSKNKKEISSRYVNLKFIINKELIFFSNYNSPKSDDFITHPQVSGLIFWNNIATQIRIKGIVKKTSKEFNQNYFKRRSKNKNALAISSFQSKEINSFEKVIENYEKVIKENDLVSCPDYWGGFSIIPYYFEFWKGDNNRLNKRQVFEWVDSQWKKYIIQP